MKSNSFWAEFIRAFVLSFLVSVPVGVLVRYLRDRF